MFFHSPASCIFITGLVKVSGETLVRKFIWTSAITLFTLLKCWPALQHVVLVPLGPGPGFVSMPDMTRSIWMIPKMANCNLTGLKVSMVLPLFTLAIFVGWLRKANWRQLCCELASGEKVVAEITSCKPLAVDSQSAERAKNRKRSRQNCNLTQYIF